MHVTRAELEALREKYVEMLAMRREHAEHGEGAVVDPSARMRALAMRFPGALREIDRLPLPEIERRVQELEPWVDPAGEPRAAPKWALWFVRYHAVLREALQVRRQAGKSHADRPRPSRLNTVVFAALAKELQTTSHEIERVLFPFDQGAERRASVSRPTRSASRGRR